MQHHLGTDLFKGGDYDPTEEVEIISHGEERHYGADGSAGSPCTKSGVLMAGRIPPFASCCCLAEASLPSLVAARGWRSLWLSVKTYHEGSLPVRDFVRLLDDWIERPPR